MALTDFLLARLAEDEHAAKNALHAARWTATTNDHDGDLSRPVTAEVRTEPYTSHLGGASSRLVCQVGPDDGMPSLTHATYDARHIARHDPTRVLAECAAKRQIVDYFELDRPAYRPIMELLALPYADHPDYRDEWRP